MSTATPRILKNKLHEPNDGSVWHPGMNDKFAWVRADDAANSKGKAHWYIMFRPDSGPIWEFVNKGPVRPTAYPWSYVDGRLLDRGSWPWLEGPSELHDLVMAEVGR